MWNCLLSVFTNCLKSLSVKNSSSHDVQSTPSVLSDSESDLKYSSFGTNNTEKQKFRHYYENENTNESIDTIQSRMSSSAIVSARNFSLKLPNFTILPQITHNKSDDWILKYSEKFDPCSLDRNRGVNKFELVPWRKSKNSVDFVNLTAWEPIKKFDLLNKNEKNVVKCLHKLQMRRTKRFIKQRDQYEKRVKRHIRIRLMFTIDLKQKKMEFFMPKIETRKFEKVDFAVSSQQQLAAIEDVMASHEGTNGGKFAKHFGYFSQRTEQDFTYRWLEQFRNTGSDDLNPFREKINSEIIVLCSKCARSVFIFFY